MKPVHLARFALAFPIAGCLAPTVDVTPAGGVYSLDGDFGASESGTVVTSDLDSLGIDDDEGGFQPRVDLRWLGTHLSVSAMAAEYDGEGTTEAEIEIGDDTISGNADVATDLELADVKGMLTFDFVPGDMVELGIGVAVSLLAVDLRMEETSGAGEIDTEEVLPVPLLAGRGAVRFGRFGVYGEAGFMDVSISDADVQLADYELGATIDVFGGGQRLAGRLAAGWRGVSIDAEYEDDDSDVEVDLDFDGPFLGFMLSF